MELGVMVLTAALTAGSTFGDETGLIIGDSDMPNPPEVYVNDVNDLYLHCDPPTPITDYPTSRPLTPRHVTH
jgi:hypothetical protein